eukprot:scaffold69049_cov61-Attheya_sp.AAC.1
MTIASVRQPGDQRTMVPPIPQGLHPKLIVSPSKAFKGLFTKMRDVKTTPEDFAFYAKRAMRLLAEDAIAELQTSLITIQTPCVDQFEGTAVVDKNQICAVSIVRAGDSLLEAVRECLPGVPVGKILIQRDEESPGKEAKLFYAKMPPGVKDMTIILCDPMLAT